MAKKIRVVISGSKSCIIISNIGVYYAQQLLTPPSILRNQAGEIAIAPADKESVVFYTTDGSLPNRQSKKYERPFVAEGKPEIRAIAYDAISAKSSAESHEKFDISRKCWKIVGTNDEKASAILDCNPSTVWHQSNNKTMPVDLVIDLGKEENISGFRYLPDQGLWNPRIITTYEFSVSQNNTDWKLVSKGEFSNIKNNPLWQFIHFASEKARYIKFTALKSKDGNNDAGYADVDVITE